MNSNNSSFIKPGFDSTSLRPSNLSFANKMKFVIAYPALRPSATFAALR
jgi:hypothetical protein